MWFSVAAASGHADAHLPPTRVMMLAPLFLALALMLVGGGYFCLRQDPPEQSSGVRRAACGRLLLDRQHSKDGTLVGFMMFTPPCPTPRSVLL